MCFYVLPVQVYPCSSDKECSLGSYCHSPQQAPSRCLTCRRRKRRCHRDAMCCPGNRCSNYVSLERRIDDGHGDPCLRSADCSQGYCCARHFWTKICKPVLRQGEVCTKLRRKGSHGLEIFQRCDCAKGLACKVWKDASSASSSGSSTSSTSSSSSSSSSKSRLHMCQRV
ncbi:hypothetical protein CRUP_033419 [Coryphaenoides rupestris]|nr:hypothetical protein CRUP_033419 [Coryphaenoides rupestris]